ncbi:MAG: hypothetical protein K0S74_1713, partial [Chlamydiales bacterium]|nr:hypothetical protein [Chlamydiales bacterium]
MHPDNYLNGTYLLRSIPSIDDLAYQTYLDIHKQTQELAKALLTILKLSVIRLSRQPLISSE